MAGPAGRFAPALGGGDGPAVRACAPGGPRRGDRGRRAGRAVRIRAGAHRAAAAAVRRARRAHRGQLAAAVDHGRGARPLRVGRARAARVRPDRARAESHCPPDVSGLLPGGARHRPVLPGQHHPVPGPGIGGQLRGLLRPGRHRGGPGGQRAAVRAFPVAGPRRAARHRHGHRVRPARKGHPVRLRQVRPRLRRPGRQHHHLPGKDRGARHGPRPGFLAGPAGRVEQADQPLERVGRLTRRRGYSRTGGGPGEPDPEPAAAHGYSFRWHGHLRPSDRRRVPGGVGTDGEPQCAAVGQRRLRGNRIGEVRPARAGHALRAALRHRPGGRAQGDRGGPGPPRPLRTGGVRDAGPRRFGRRVPGGVTRADGHPAAAEAAGVLRPGGGGRADPPRPHPGRVGASLHPPAQRAGPGGLRPPVDGTGAAKDAGSAALSGAADAARGRLRRIQRRRGRPAAPRHGIQALDRAHATAARPVLRRHARAARRRRRGDRPHLRKAGSLRQFRLPGKPCAELRVAGVLLVVVQAAPPGGVLRGAAACPADGVLLATVAGGRCAPARRDGARPGRQRQPGARHPRERRHRGPPRPGHGSPHRRRPGRTTGGRAKSQRPVRFSAGFDDPAATERAADRGAGDGRGAGLLRHAAA